MLIRGVEGTRGGRRAYVTQEVWRGLTPFRGVQEGGCTSQEVWRGLTPFRGVQEGGCTSQEVWRGLTPFRGVQEGGCTSMILIWMPPHLTGASCTLLSHAYHQASPPHYTGAPYLLLGHLLGHQGARRGRGLMGPRDPRVRTYCTARTPGALLPRSYQDCHPNKSRPSKVGGGKPSDRQIPLLWPSMRLPTRGI